MFQRVIWWEGLVYFDLCSKKILDHYPHIVYLLCMDQGYCIFSCVFLSLDIHSFVF